jgi:hypothetical protein
MCSYPQLTACDELVNDVPVIECTINDPQVSFSLWQKTNNPFLILNANIRSMRKNFDSFRAFISMFPVRPSVIVFTETWLTKETDVMFDIDDYSRFNIFRSPFGGGISVFCLSYLQPKLCKSLTYVGDIIEILTFTISILSAVSHVICVYRPPRNEINVFNDFFFDEIIDKLPVNAKCIICGDLNINLFNPLSLPSVANFYNGMLGLGFFPVITVPTRFSPDNSITKFSLLDHIWSNCILGCNHRSGAIDYEITDHLPVFYIFSAGPSNIERRITYRSYATRNVAKFVEGVASVDFDSFTNVESIDRSFSSFIDCMLRIFKKSFPLKKKKIFTGTSNPPWMTNDIRSLIRKKYKLLKQFRRGIISRKAFTIFRNLLSFVIKKTKCLHQRRKILECGGDHRKVWQILNGMVGRNTSRRELKISARGSRLSDVDAANSFNDFFTSVASDLVSNLSISDTPFVMPVEPPLASCFFYPINLAEITELVREVKSKRVHKDEIQPFLLHQILPYIAPFILQMFNTCLREGIYPSVLKRSRVVPIHKDGDASDIRNYRPISTLSVFNRIFEKVIHNRLKNFFSTSSVLSRFQFGFREKSSTSLAIVNLICDVLPSFNSKTFTICLFLDLRKAFDTVDIKLLLAKLNMYGVRGTCNKLIESYLRGRDQFVVVNEVASAVLPVTVGVPQGSVLGPFLFSLFINDIALIPDVRCILFADDAAFYVHGDTLDAATLAMERFISRLSSWLVSNRLVAHESKTKLMLFTPRPVADLPNIRFFGTVLEWVDDIKYLGVILDNKLSFSKQIDLVSQKLSKARGILYAVSSMLPISSLKMLYYSLAYSHVAQSVIVWGGVSSNKLKPISTQINSILRTILKVKYDSNRIPLMSTNCMYRALSLLKLEDIHRYFILKFCHYAFFVDTFSYNRFFATLVPTHDYGTRGNRLNFPPVRLEIEKSFIIFQIVKLYNALPDYLTSPMSPLQLKRSFKTHILNTY